MVLVAFIKLLCLIWECGQCAQIDPCNMPMMGSRFAIDTLIVMAVVQAYLYCSLCRFKLLSCHCRLCKLHGGSHFLDSRQWLCQVAARQADGAGAAANPAALSPRFNKRT